MGQAEVRDRRAVLRGHFLPVPPLGSLTPGHVRVRVLGSAAGGGFPQWNCRCGTCEAAREGVRARPRTQSSLAIRGDEGPWFLVNASPDARQQLETLAPDRVDGVRAPPVAGVLLTDAEIDHTAGLLLLRESAAPVRVFGAAGVERALTDGTLLRMLERYCGVDWRTLEPGRAQPLDGSSLVVEPFEVGGDAPRYLDGSTSSRRAGSSSATARAAASLTYVPGLAALDDGVLARFAASDLVLVDGTFWRDDELARLGISAPQRARHGPRAALGPGGTLEALAGLRAPAQGARPHQQHEPDPARGLARARGGRPGGRRSRLRWPRGPAVTVSARSEFVARREFMRACARRARATTTCTRSTGAWTRASSRARSCSAGSRTASTTSSASRSRTRRSCPTAPRWRSGASGSSASSTTTARPRGRAASSRGCGSARPSASRATSSCRSGGSCPRCATPSTPT